MYFFSLDAKGRAMDSLKRYLLVLLFIGIALGADDIDALLENIEKKTDLSEKTRLANSGVSFIWTRDDLNRMQITNLKQILNTMYPFGYNENRFGLTDPLSYNANQPSMSGTIRLYIDNQEITTGLYGSGLILLGNTNIDWVDHIEIYTQNPTYEYATESTVTLIKLYTKSVAKDEGSRINVGGGSYAKRYIDAYHADWIGEWSYFVFGYSGDDKREKHKSDQTTLSRDKKVNLATATLHHEQTNLLVQAFTQDGDGFANFSIDATPEKSTIKAKYFHVGIDSKIEDFAYLLTYSYTQVESELLDDVTPIQNPPFYGLFPMRSGESKTHDSVVTGEIKYKKRIRQDTLLMGVKYRTKHATWDKSLINGIDMAARRDKSIQNIATVYMENQCLVASNSLFTLGVEYQRVENKDTPQNDNLWMYRLGHTYTTDRWTLKTLYAHTLTPLEPYLVKSDTFLADPSKYYKPQRMDTFVEDIIYQNDEEKYEFILDYTEARDYFLPNRYGKIENYDKSLKMFGIDFRWTKEYRRYDKLFVDATYREIKNTPVNSGTLKEYKGVVRNINTYKQFDIFNELVVSHNNFSHKNYFDYSAGVRYRYTDDIVVALKGINLFDDERQSSYYRVDPNTLQLKEPLQISPIDKEIVLSASWTF